MSDQTNDHHDAHHDDESHGGYGLYITVFIALCVLTSFSFLTYFDFWRSNVSVGVSRAFMMAVSCTKALLVILFFMHLKWEASWKWVLTIPASIMSVFLMAMLIPDVGLRMRNASEHRMIHAAERPEVTEVLVNDHAADGHDDDGHTHAEHKDDDGKESH